MYMYLVVLSINKQDQHDIGCCSREIRILSICISTLCVLLVYVYLRISLSFVSASINKQLAQCIRRQLTWYRISGPREEKLRILYVSQCVFLCNSVSFVSVSTHLLALSNVVLDSWTERRKATISLCMDFHFARTICICESLCRICIILSTRTFYQDATSLVLNSGAEKEGRRIHFIYLDREETQFVSPLKTSTPSVPRGGPTEPSPSSPSPFPTSSPLP